MKNPLKIVFFASLLPLFTACSDNSFNEIDGALLKNPNFSTSVLTPTFTVSQTTAEAVQTNGLGGYLLGQYTQAPFGTLSATIVAQVGLSSVNPVFGEQSQANENKNNKQENETVTEAYLYIPFFNPLSSLQKPTYTQNAEYTLDSIYGNKAAQFKIDVKELNYYLSDIGTNLNAKEYYSNDSAINAHIGASVASATGATYTLTNKAVVRYQFDDPKTTEDESKKVQDVLAPGLRIPLSASFFQSKIISQEGAAVLSNLNDFKQHFKGLVISASDFSNDLVMMLNTSAAKIEINYSYTSNDKTLKKRFELPISGITMNLFSQNGGATTDSSKIYLSGALGHGATLKIADADINTIKNQKLMITDASILLYVDQSVTYQKEPERLFIYNANTGAPLADYSYDPTANAQTAAYSHLVHLVPLYKVNGKGVYYRLRITNHLLNIVNGNTTNVPLGIAVISNVKNSTVKNYLTGSQKGKTTESAVVTPLSTVIKEVKIEVNYSKVRN